MDAASAFPQNHTGFKARGAFEGFCFQLQSKYTTRLFVGVFFYFLFYFANVLKLHLGRSRRVCVSFRLLRLQHFQNPYLCDWALFRLLFIYFSPLKTSRRHGSSSTVQVLLCGLPLALWTRLFPGFHRGHSNAAARPYV